MKNEAKKIDIYNELRLLEVKEICSEAKISIPFLYSLWKQGKGPLRTKIGRRTFVRARDFRVWLDSLVEESE